MNGRTGGGRGQSLGEILPLAVVVAISPVPIIATILVLIAPSGHGSRFGFVVGWIVGITVTVVVFTVLAAVTGLANSSGSSGGVGWAKVGLGVLLLWLAARQWRGRSQPGEPAKLPGWMAATESLTFPKAAGLGFALAALNPKNLLLCAAAGVSIGNDALAVAARDSGPSDQSPAGELDVSRAGPESSR